MWSAWREWTAEGRSVETLPAEMTDGLFVTIKAKGRTVEETIVGFYQLLAEYKTEVSGRLRDIQSEEDDE